jgi:hypothetical protein
MKEFKNYSKTKKKLLLESIRIAKDMLESKGKGDEEKEKIRKNISIEKPIKRVKVKQIKKVESDVESCEEKEKPRRKLRRLMAPTDKLLNSKRRRSDSIYSLT